MVWMSFGSVDTRRLAVDFYCSTPSLSSSHDHNVIHVVQFGLSKRIFFSTIIYARSFGFSKQTLFVFNQKRRFSRSSSPGVLITHQTANDALSKLKSLVLTPYSWAERWVWLTWIWIDLKKKINHTFRYWWITTNEKAVPCMSVKLETGWKERKMQTKTSIFDVSTFWRNTMWWLCNKFKCISHCVHPHPLNR